MFETDLVFAPAFDELRPSVVDANDLLHLLERRVRADVVVKGKGVTLGRVLEIIIINKQFCEEFETFID